MANAMADTRQGEDTRYLIELITALPGRHGKRPGSSDRHRDDALRSASRKHST